MKVVTDRGRAEPLGSICGGVNLLSHCESSFRNLFISHRCDWKALKERDGDDTPFVVNINVVISVNRTANRHWCCSVSKRIFFEALSYTFE